MKSLKIVLALCQVISLAAHAQTHYGSNAGTLGANHSYFGVYAGNAATSGGSNNSFFGSYSGRSTTSGLANTAAGFNAMYYNTQGVSNTAIGAESLFSNLGGIFNVAIGNYALYSSATAGYNTAIGYAALYANTTGGKNTAVGYLASTSGTYGRENVAIGYGALKIATSASFNAVTGVAAMRLNVVGGLNAVYGHDAAYGVTGSYNSAFGFGALYAGSSECVSSYNSALGASTGFGGSQCVNYTNATAIGYNAVVTASNQVRIGDSNVTSIGGKVAWSTLSDGRFKRDLKKNVAGLDFIKQLKPVSYILDQDGLDKFLGRPDSTRNNRIASRGKSQRQVGFIAQDVEALVKKSGFMFTGIDGPKNENDTYSIRYAEFVVPLVKAVQELSARVDSRQKEIARLEEALSKYKEDQLANKRSTGAALSQNHPNPFSRTTKVVMDVPDATQYASLIIYNLDGKELQNIEVKERGTTYLEISSNELSPGMYLYALIADGKVVDTKRLVLTK